MPKIRSLALLLLAIAPWGCAQGAPQAPVPPNDPSLHPYVALPTPEPLAQGKVVEEVLGAQQLVIALPPGYQDVASASYPTVVFLHSYQQDAHQLTKNTRFVRFAADLGWIVAAGDLAGEQHWGNPRAIAMHRAMLSRLRDHYHADPHRWYYTGFSMGGGTALLAALECKGTDDEPAAVASSQGWSDLGALRGFKDGLYQASIDAAYGGTFTDADRARGDLVSRAKDLAGIPIYLEHGDADEYLPISQSQALDQALAGLNLPHVFRTYQGLGHSETTIHEGAILDFFKDKRRAR
jgi:dienelactone hydrolase